MYFTDLPKELQCPPFPPPKKKKNSLTNYLKDNNTLENPKIKAICIKIK
jgi:hypothetical protein